jgi:cytochrome c-type biogenesis protein CcmH/NrfG
MKQQSAPSGSNWTGTQAYVMAVICLVVGVAIGYLVRGSSGSNAANAAPATSAAPTAGMGNMQAMQQQPTPEQLKHMADVQAAPLLEKLKSDPSNPQLLSDVGNLYYDAHQFPTAIDYYQQSLKAKPGNSDVRVDMGTAMWYMGDADGAIEQFKTVLKTEPTKPIALMNLGVVEWQGKMNVNEAVAAWEKLLATNPNFEGKEKVQELIAQVKKHSNLTGKTTKPAM